MRWWVLDAFNAGGLPLVSAWAIWVIVSITLHELAHGWAAISRGDTTPIDTGHMTWNPLVHMGPVSLIMFAVTGIAWGLMPIDPTRMRGRHADAFVSACGPLMNFGLAAFCVLATIAAAVIMGKPGGASAAAAVQNAELQHNLRIFFGFGCAINITLGLFNLLPAPPLDGSRIAASFFPGYRRLMSGQGGQFVGLALFVVAFLFADQLIGKAGPRIWREGSDLGLELLARAGVGPGPFMHRP